MKKHVHLDSYAPDAETITAIEEGIRAADETPKRWTPEQVLEDARELSNEFRGKLGLPNST